jgi:hypothetical protein
MELKRLLEPAREDQQRRCVAPMTLRINRVIWTREATRIRAMCARNVAAICLLTLPLRSCVRTAICMREVQVRVALMAMELTLVICRAVNICISFG